MTTNTAKGIRVAILALILSGGPRAGASIRYTATELGPENGYSQDAAAGIVKDVAGTKSYVFQPVSRATEPLPNSGFESKAAPPFYYPYPTGGEHTEREVLGNAWRAPDAPDLAVYTITRYWERNQSIYHPYTTTSAYLARQDASGGWDTLGKIATGAGNDLDHMIQVQGVNSQGQVAALYSTFQSSASGSHPRWYPELTVYDSKTGTSTAPMQSFDGSDRYIGKEYGLKVYGFDQEGRLLLRVAVAGSRPKGGENAIEDPAGYRTILLTPIGLPLEAPVPEPTTLVVLAAGVLAFAGRAAARRR